MGGSVVVPSCSNLLEKKYRIAGVAVLDVVEGTASVIVHRLVDTSLTIFQALLSMLCRL